MMSVAHTIEQHRSANSAEAPATRPDISIYWKPGCSNCLRVKEFLEGTGMPFESLNVEADSDALEELMAAGLRSVPAVRNGDRVIYGQNLDDVAAHIGIIRTGKKLSNDALLDRWNPLLTKAIQILEKFSDADLQANVIPARMRSVQRLAIHVFQIVIAFRMEVEEGITENKPIEGYVDPAIRTREDVLAFAKGVNANLETWLATGGRPAIPARMATFYGEQDSSQVVERAVWHCAQHVRQLDIIAAGRLGAELEVPQELYEGLPLPKRLWV
jgi:glutaredoxin